MSGHKTAGGEVMAGLAFIYKGVPKVGVGDTLTVFDGGAWELVKADKHLKKITGKMPS